MYYYFKVHHIITQQMKSDRAVSLFAQEIGLGRLICLVLLFSLVLQCFLLSLSANGLLYRKQGQAQLFVWLHCFPLYSSVFFLFLSANDFLKNFENEDEKRKTNQLLVKMCYNCHFETTFEIFNLELSSLRKNFQKIFIQYKNTAESLSLVDSEKH